MLCNLRNNPTVGFIIGRSLKEVGFMWIKDDPPSSLVIKGVKKVIVMDESDMVHRNSSEEFDPERLIPCFFDVGSFYVTTSGVVIFCCAYHDDLSRIFEYRRIPLCADLRHFINGEMLNPNKSPVLA